jgi:hypothetical protein
MAATVRQRLLNDRTIAARGFTDLFGAIFLIKVDSFDSQLGLIAPGPAKLTLPARRSLTRFVGNSFKHALLSLSCPRKSNSTSLKSSVP